MALMSYAVKIQYTLVSNTHNSVRRLKPLQGFGNNKLSVEITSTADYFARNGYIVLTYSSQGFGASSGCVRLNSFDYDVKNSMQLIDNMLDEPSSWSTTSPCNHWSLAM